MQMTEPNPRVRLKNILFTTDFSPASDTAFPYAVTLARWFGAKLFLAHVVPPGTDANVEGACQTAKRKMATYIESHPAKDAVCDPIVEVGDLDGVISSVIEQHSIDLLVLGTHGRQGAKKWVLGSKGEEIFHLATCPVLTVGPKVTPKPVDFEDWKPILFATDFSDASLHALPYALSLAEENQASLILVHQVALASPDRNWQEVAANWQARLRALIPPDAGLWCSPEFVVGMDFPAAGIVQVAAERSANLIVMGVHLASPSKVAGHFHWSTAYDVVCNAHFPVLTVRA